MCWDVRRKRRVCETNCVRRSLDRKLLQPMKVDQDIDYGKRRHKEEDGGSEESRRPKRSEIVISLESGQSRYESTFAFMQTIPLIVQSCLNPIRSFCLRLQGILNLGGCPFSY